MHNKNSSIVIVPNPLQKRVSTFFILIKLAFRIAVSAFQVLITGKAVIKLRKKV